MNAEAADDQAMIADLVAEDTGQPVAEVVGKDPSEAVVDDPAAPEETAPAETTGAETEEGAESDVPSQAAETEAEASEAEAAPEAEAEPRRVKLGDTLDQIEGLTSEHRSTINEAVNQLVRDRVGREKAKQTALTAEVEALRVKVSEMESAPAPVEASPDNPFAAVKTLAALQQERGRFERIVDEVEALLPEVLERPDYVENVLRSAKVAVKGADGGDDYSPDRMRAALERLKANAERNLRRHLPLAETHLKQRQQFEAEALNSMPVLKDPANPFTVAVDKFLREHPEVARLPFGRLFTARAMRDNAMERHMAGQKTPKATPTPAVRPDPKPPVVKTAGKPAPPANAKTAAVSAAQKKFEETCSDSDLIELLKAEQD